MNDEIKNIIIDSVGSDSYKKGLLYNKNYIRKLDTRYKDVGVKFFLFDVESESSNNFYDVAIIIDNNNGIQRRTCSCARYRSIGTCKHIAACMINYNEVIFSKPKDNYEKTYELLENFVSINDKEKLNLEIELEISANGVNVRPKIGVDRLYLLTGENKLSGFKDAYFNNGTFYFGIKFVYDSAKYYFDKEDKKIIDFLLGYKEYFSYGYYNYYRRDYLNLNDRETSYLLELLRNRQFYVRGYGKVNGIKFEEPFNFELSLDNEDYKIMVEDLRKYLFLDDDIKYVIYNNYLYVISENYSKLFKHMFDKNLNALYIKKDSIKIFTKGIFKDIKSHVKIDSNIKDLVIAKPDISLYFDMLKNSITCDIKLDYVGNVINYFDDNDKIIRDDEEENKLIRNLKKCNFKIVNKKIILEDLDDIVYFIEHELLDFSENYNVYTSKKISDVNIIKKSKMESNFSIGRDNIMTYKFSLNNINNSELDSIILSLKNKKKYYKLKSGDIVNLEENKELNELENIIDDLDLSSDNLSSGNIIIPKYRAFYINSLKENKYKSITTNYSFDKFINDFVKYKNLNITFDFDDEKTLRDYQKDGVKWLYTLYKCDLGGILADEMGLGKSIQTISFIKQIIKEKEDAKIMIVCPTSLVYNWQKEFEKFAPNLKYVTVSESKEKRLSIIKDFEKYNVFITSYGLIRNDNDEYEDKNFELCVIDEAQMIKNYQANMTREVKKIKSRTKIALTGTPIENSVLELWSIFDYIMPGYLNNITKFRESFGIKEFDDVSLNKIRKLNYLIKPFILRRRKKDVSKELPDKVENNIYLDMPDIQKALYVRELSECKSEMDELIRKEGFNKARFKILQLLTKLRQICVDPSVMYNDYKYESVKIEKLVESVKNYVSENHKILIFSSFKRVIDNVQKRFEKEKISNYKITGEVSSKKRMELVDCFNEDDTSCFLITLKSGGTGLNLTKADVVIHLDIWWNPQVENQATDRAHRIGQKNKVTVIKMVTKGTIEERIIELQEKKQKLSDNIIEGKDDATLVSKLEKEDMINLLSFDKE